MPSLSFMVRTTLRSTPFLAFRIDISGSFPASIHSMSAAAVYDCSKHRVRFTSSIMKNVWNVWDAAFPFSAVVRRQSPHSEHRTSRRMVSSHAQYRARRTSPAGARLNRAWPLRIGFRDRVPESMERLPDDCCNASREEVPSQPKAQTYIFLPAGYGKRYAHLP